MMSNQDLDTVEFLAAFKEASLYDQKTAESYRRNILSRGNTKEPLELLKKFRGREPRVDVLLRRRALLH